MCQQASRGVFIRGRIRVDVAELWVVMFGVMMLGHVLGRKLATGRHKRCIFSYKNHSEVSNIWIYL
jgi:hypothetical protein